MRHSLSRLGLAFIHPDRCAMPDMRDRFRRWSFADTEGDADPIEDDDLHFLARLHRRWPDPARPAIARSADGQVVALVDGFLLGGDDRNDAERVLEAYRRHGRGFADDLRGWFVAVILDRAAGTVVLATDPFGMHQMHVARTDEGIFVATDVRSLLELARLPSRRDDAGLADYLAYGAVLNDRTLFEGIRRMPPAALWVWDGHECKEGTHFDFSTLTAGEPLRDEDEAIDAAQEVFGRVVPRYLDRSDDLSFSLSGGLDTRALSSFIDRPVRTHTYGSNPRSLDEKLAVKVARELGCPHEFIRVSEAFFPRFTQLAVDTLALGNGMSHVEDTFTLFVADQLDAQVHKMITGKYGTQITQGVKAGVYDGRYLFALDPVDRDLRPRLEEMARGSLTAAEGRLGDDLQPDDRDLMFIVLEECRRGWSGQLAVERGRLVHLAPYADPDIVELMFRLPPGLRRGQALQLALIRRGNPRLASLPMNRGLLANPDGLRSRLSALRYKGLYKLDIASNARRVPPRLRADALPWARLGTTQYRQWWRGPLADQVRDILLDPVSLSRGVFQREAIVSAVEDHIGRRADRSVQINKMLSLELTHRIFFDA